MDAIAEIKKIYYAATKGTIDNDIDRAIDLLKTLPSDDDREKVAVYMDGLAQMRTEWSASARPKARERRRDPAEAASGRVGGKQAMRGGVGPQKAQKARSSSRPSLAGSRPPSGARKPAAPPARSGRSKASSRRSR